MPKVKDKKPPILSWISPYPELRYKKNENIVYCTACDEEFQPNSKIQINRHISDPGHIEKMVQIKEEPGLINEIGSLAKALISSNASLNVISNPCMQKFFFTYFKGFQIPTEADLINAYLEEFLEPTLNTIREDLKNKYLWINVNEAKDGCDHYMVYVIVGGLDRDKNEQNKVKSHLIALKSLEDILDLTLGIAELVQNSFNFLWGEEANSVKDKVLVLVTSTDSIMLEVGKLLSNIYPNIIHVTCLLHCLNKVADTLAGEFGNICDLMNNINEVFIKAPDRVERFKEVLPDLPLPPNSEYEDFLWVNNAIYYADNFDKLKELIKEFDPEERCTIEMAQTLLDTPKVKKDLLFIKKHFTFWPPNLHRLQMTHLLTDTFQFIEYIHKMLNAVPDPIGEIVQGKFIKLTNATTGYSILQSVKQIFLKKSEVKNQSQEKLQPEILPYLTYAPMKLIDIERADNLKELLLESKTMTHEQLEQMMIVSYEKRMYQYYTMGKRKKKMQNPEQDSSESDSEAGPSRE